MPKYYKCARYLFDIFPCICSVYTCQQARRSFLRMLLHAFANEVRMGLRGGAADVGATLEISLRGGILFLHKNFWRLGIDFLIFPLIG